MAEPTQIDPVVVTDSTPDAAPSPVAKQPPAMPNFQQMLMDRLNRPLSGGGGNPQQALQQTIAGEQAKSDVAMKMAREKEQTMRPLQEAKVARIGQTEEQQAGISKELNTPFQVPQETVADFSALGGLVGIMGVMLGTSGKMSAQNVLSSATGILDGYKKGRADLVSQAKQSFEANMKRLTALSSQVQAELKTYMEKAAVKDQTAALSLEKVAAEANNGIVAAVVTGQSAFKIQEMNQQLANSTRAAQTHYDTVLMQLAKDQQAREDAAAKPPTMMQDQNGNPLQWDGKTRSWVAADMPEDVTSITRIGTPPKGKGGGEIGPVAFLNQTIGKTSGDPKIDQKIIDAGRAVVSTNSLLDRLKDPEIKTGWQSALNGFQEKLKSLRSDKRELTDSEMKSIIDGSVNSTSKNAVFLKDQLFTQYQIEKEAQGGRLTVEMMRQGAKVLDPTNVTKDTYIAILGGRREDLFKILTGYNLDPTDINKLVGKFATQQGSAAPASNVAPVVTNPNAIQSERAALTALLQNITDPTLAAKYKERFKLRTGQDY